jgi:hypothetical protein
MNISLKHLAPAAVALGIATAVVTASPANAAPAASSATHVHFATPQDAMRYLAAAYNRGDVVAIHHVTTPASFQELQGMHSEAVNLKLQWCQATGHGDFHCHFQHRYPKSFHTNGYGASDMIVAPALTPGWYMYSFWGEGCG